MHKNRAVAVASICVGFTCSPAIAQTVAAGFTPGSLGVNETGAAEYRIPIRIPPGRAAMEPKVALAYNSQSGSGLAGMGWNLAGLSAIQRCPPTIAQDGKRTAINYNAADRYCLDGQRLVAVLGSYGADGTTYRTERESFTKVVSYGSAGSGPAWFKVWTKSGLVMEYGNTLDSRVEAQGKSSVRVYAVNKILDTAGNYMTASYHEDLANGEFYPTRIDYSGNQSTGDNTFASVRFVYAGRPDPIYANIAGSALRMSVRLTNVQTYVGSSMVTDYRLAYEQGAATGRSRLSSVKECTGDATACFAPITFSWQEPSVGVQNFSWGGGHGNGSQGWRAADLFGDGRQIYYTTWGDGMHHATRVNASGTLQNWSWSGHGVGNGGWDVADLFGDGRAVYYTHHDTTHYATRFNPDGTSQSWTWPGGHGVGAGGWRLVNLFGDGRQVYYTHNSDGQHFATRLNPDGTLENFYWAGAHGVGDQGWTLADLFGDGRQVYYTHSGDGTHYATRFNPDGTSQSWTWSGGHGVGNAGWQHADLFGEGRQVYYTHSTDGSHYATRLNSDGTMQNWTWTGGHGVAVGSGCSGSILCAVVNFYNTTSNWRLSDLFGDGRQVYYTRSHDGGHYFTRLNPDGTLQNWSFGGGHWATDAGWQDADVLGDGRRAYYAHSTDGGHHVTRFVSAKPDLLLSITNSLGHVTSVVHKPLTDDSVYSKLTTATYPSQDTRMPLYVVSSVSSSNGIGGTATSNYFFVGARLHMTGPAFLGFSETRTTDTGTGMTTSRTYRLDYPYHGLATQSKRKQPSGVVVAQADTTWTTTALTPTVESGGLYHKVEPAQSVERGYELNGNLITTVTASTTYDSYGNALTATTDTGDGYSKVTTNTYESPNTTSWILGRLSTASVTASMPGATATRTSSFAYDAVSGFLTKEIVEPGSSTHCLVTAYAYDSFGNKTSATSRACNGSFGEAATPAGDAYSAPRTATSSFAQTTANPTQGQFPTSSANALLQVESKEFDARFGVVTKLTGPNLLATTWAYDSFGRKTSETRADGTTTTWAYTTCGTCPANGRYFMTVSSPGQPTASTYFDNLGREIRTESQGFDGTPVRKDTEYNALGQVLRTSLPYYAGQTPQWTSFTYDLVGRVLTATDPTSAVTTTVYNGLTTTTTNALNQTETRTKNSQGQLVQVTRQ